MAKLSFYLEALLLQCNQHSALINLLLQLHYFLVMVRYADDRVGPITLGRLQTVTINR